MSRSIETIAHELIEAQVLLDESHKALFGCGRNPLSSRWRIKHGTDNLVPSKSLVRRYGLYSLDSLRAFNSHFPFFIPTVPTVGQQRIKSFIPQEMATLSVNEGTSWRSDRDLCIVYVGEHRDVNPNSSDIGRMMLVDYTMIELGCQAGMYLADPDGDAERVARIILA